jgi:hypothetical protein
MLFTLDSRIATYFPAPAAAGGAAAAPATPAR